MKHKNTLSVQKATVLVAAAFLLVARLAVGFADMTATQNGLIRFVLGSVCALLVLVRPKPETEFKASFNASILIGITGVVFVVAGLIFGVNQFEWLGFLLVIIAFLLWSLPAAFSRDIWLAMFLLYWAHPLPNQVFGSLQLIMQKASTAGSEMVLHAFNVRAWADGFLIHTGLNTYEIPSWCSGMRTATTVIILSLGLGILWRLKWGQCLALVVLAIVQSLLLNIGRISAMVVLTPPGAGDLYIRFLHNSTGFIVITSVFLVFLEVYIFGVLKRRKAARLSGHAYQHIAVISSYPPFWRVLGRHWIMLTIVGIFIAGISVFAYRNRPYHRAAMIKDVAVAMRNEGDLENAQRALDTVRKLVPNDENWFFEWLRLLLMRGKYERVISELDNFTAHSVNNPVERDILRAYSLIGLGRFDQAMTIAKALPDQAKKENARVAMILAEMARYANEPETVAENIAVAARILHNTERVRSLYPYLHDNKKWDAIAYSHLNKSYQDPIQAFVAMEACMKTDRIVVLADLVRQAMVTWPNDLRILAPLFFLTIRTEREEWEDLFAQHLIGCVKSSEAIDDLYELASKCFYLGRPDLAWMIYKRIGALDPSHPALALIIVHNGNNWFAFRKRHLGLPSTRWRDKIDIRSMFLLGQSWQPSIALLESVPFVHELARENTVAFRKQLLVSALAELEKRDNADQLSQLMQYEYVKALEIGEGIHSARNQLTRIAKKSAKTESQCAEILSELYEKRGDWGNVYESLRNHFNFENDSQEEIRLAPLVRLCVSQINIRLGLAAMHTARQAVALFPHSDQAAFILAMALASYDSSEEALFVLSRPRIRNVPYIDMLEGELLFQTERFVEAREFCRAAFLSYVPLPLEQTQKIVLPPAEISVQWHKVSLPSHEAFQSRARILTQNAGSVSSPFIDQLTTLWLAAYNAKCEGDTVSLAKWTACGRDKVEKATALHHLMLLLCRHNKLEAAREVLVEAVRILPTEPHLWRALIGLSGADPLIIAAAREACPRNSEIWLAELVSNLQLAADPWPENIVCARLADIPKDFFTPAAWTRAGHYLYRGGMIQAAAIASSNAI
ncbi:MAG: archaeosortase/exosortase family protein, partial [Lentisphaerae bacterium]|nr:archaeosortase/exosortase family protein [Lentisphaerota bacterium]